MFLPMWEHKHGAPDVFWGDSTVLLISAMLVLAVTSEEERE